MSQVSHNAPLPTFALIGANGFIGTRIREIARERELSHRGYTRKDPAVAGDGAADPNFVQSQAVVWAASMITPAVAEEEPAAVKYEQDAFRMHIAAIKAAERPPHLVLMSSGGTVYGGDAAPYSEVDEPSPVNKYGEAKLQLEEIARESGIQTTVLRVANAYGPGQRAVRGQGVIGYWLRALRDHQPITIFGNGSAVRDYVYVDDIVDAVLAAAQLQSPEPFRIINVGSGEPTTLTKLARLCLAAANADAPVEYLEHRGFDAPANWLDVRAAHDYLGWQPTTSLETGLSRTWEWIRIAK